MMTNKKPKPGTPEFDEWLANRAKKLSQELFHSSADFEERGVISGGQDSIKEDDKPHIISNNRKNTDDERH